MASFNRVTLLGNLTRDPQLKQLVNATVAEFGMAVSRKFKSSQTGEEREEVCFVDCSAFGRSAEVINEYCRKGRSILVEGRLKYDTWDDKMGGGRRSKLSVVVENFQLLGSPREGEQRTLEEVVEKKEEPKPRKKAIKQAFAEADIPF